MLKNHHLNGGFVFPPSLTHKYSHLTDKVDKIIFWDKMLIEYTYFKNKTERKLLKTSADEIQNIKCSTKKLFNELKISSFHELMNAVLVIYIRHSKLSWDCYAVKPISVVTSGTRLSFDIPPVIYVLHKEDLKNPEFEGGELNEQLIIENLEYQGADSGRPVWAASYITNGDPPMCGDIFEITVELQLSRKK